MTKKQILSASSGYIFEDGIPRFGKVIHYGLSLTKKKKPILCYLGTASGDCSEWTETFYEICKSENVTPRHLQLFNKPNVDDIREHILSSDMVLVPGGSVANLMVLWRLHGLDTIFKEAWEKGVVLFGWSAGSICWFSGGTTDSFGDELQPFKDSIGLLPYSNGVHYDSEVHRRPLLQQLIQEGELPEGYATDDGVALHFVDDKLHRVVSEAVGKSAYHIYKKDSDIVEEKLIPDLL